MTLSVRHLTIGDIRFHIRKNRLGLPVCAQDRSDYRQFLSESDSSEEGEEGAYLIDVDVFVEKQSLELPAGSRKIFDDNSCCEIHSRSDEYFVRHVFPPLTSPVWTARLDISERRVDIFCNPEIVDGNRNLLTHLPFSYPLDQVLTVLLLAENHGALIHAAGWESDGRAWIFPGKSGAGKSTVSNLIRDKTGETLLSDDRIAVRKIENRFFAYGTPWPGEGGFAENRRAPLKGVFFLEQGEKNEISQLDFKDAFYRFLPVVSVPWYDKGKIDRTMSFLEQLAAEVPGFLLTFRNDQGVVDVLQNYIRRFSA